MSNSKKEEDVVFVNKIPLHTLDRLRHLTKDADDNDVTFVNKKPQNIWDRLKLKTKILEFDTEILTEIPL